MKQLDCGCELSPGGKLVSLCAIHGEHMHAVSEMNKHPRSELPDRQLQRDLAKALAPEVLRKWNTVTDPGSTAECLFQHIHEIMRRFD